ncbi:Teichoic acid translocation permease protein TagG [Thermoflexales bacterium]|nr:Teichoic acid translocation permease protein TagG [Thermoflexales bacterium]
MRTSLVELWQYRELLYNLTVRDLKVRYKNSVLGIAWSLLNPILMMLVFTVVYTVMLGQSNRRDYAAFILCGLLPWNFFSGSIMGGVGSVVNNGYLIKKVYFPRAVLPISIMLSNLVNFLVALPVYFVLAWLLGVQFTPYVLFLPVVLLVEMIFIQGVSLLLAALNVFYRDVQQIMEVLILAWFFVTPVIWDVNLLPESRTVLGLDVPVQRLTYILNPMASIVATYRDLLYHGRSIGWDFFLRTALTALIVLLIGFFVFNRLKGRFAEEV